MTVLKGLFLALAISVVSLLSLAPAVSAQEYGPSAPTPTEPPGTSAPDVSSNATAPQVTTAVSVKGKQQPPAVAAPDVGSNQLPVTGSTVFPLVAGGIGLVALGLVLRQADRADDKDEI